MKDNKQGTYETYTYKTSNRKLISLISIPYNINPLNAELIPICHLLALLGAYHILHISRIRVKLIIENSV